MTQTNSQSCKNPSAVIEDIYMRLKLVRHTLTTTHTSKITDDLMTGLETVCKNVQDDVVELMQFCESMGEEYLERRAAQ